jgi:hypothetical protein
MNFGSLKDMENSGKRKGGEYSKNILWSGAYW